VLLITVILPVVKVFHGISGGDINGCPFSHKLTKKLNSTIIPGRKIKPAPVPAERFYGNLQ
jgi:hypothetical protein